MSSKLYELRFYAFNLKGKMDFKEMCGDSEFWKKRVSFSKIVGIWETEILDATEFFHIVEYEDLEDLFRARKAMAENKDKDFWPKAQKVVEDYGTFHNSFTLLSPHTPQLCTQFTASPTAVYELQTMKSDDHESSPTLGENGILVGRFCNLYGQTNTEYRLIRFPDAKSAEAAARARMTKQDEMKAMSESRLLVPLPMSDLQ